jgi:hypothetical protein
MKRNAQDIIKLTIENFQHNGSSQEGCSYWFGDFHKDAMYAAIKVTPNLTA